MAALDTVQNYIASARVLLQDTGAPYRYDDPGLVLALSFALLDARRIRPDLFLGQSFAVQSFTVNDTTPVNIDAQYRVPILYYIVGHAQLRDEEDTQDARASALLGKFTSQMLSVNG